MPTERELCLEACLIKFLKTIEATGGIINCPGNNGNTPPIHSPEWGDLGSAYMHACKFLQRKPVIGDPETHWGEW